MATTPAPPVCGFAILQPDFQKQTDGFPWSILNYQIQPKKP